VLVKTYWEFFKEFNSQAKRTQLAIAAVAMLIGILIVTQIRVQHNAARSLQASTEEDLGKIVSGLNSEINLLRAESANIKLQLYKIEQKNEDSSAIMEESFKSLSNLKIIAGLSGVTGPGLRVQVSDENNELEASDLYDIINELRAGGAEAISVNGIRVIAKTGVRQTQEGIFLDDKIIAPPYEIIAIGEPEGLYGELTIAGGIRDTISSALQGVSFEIAKEDELMISAIVSSETAKP